MTRARAIPKFFLYATFCRSERAGWGKKWEKLPVNR